MRNFPNTMPEWQQVEENYNDLTRRGDVPFAEGMAPAEDMPEMTPRVSLPMQSQPQALDVAQETQAEIPENDMPTGDLPQLTRAQKLLEEYRSGLGRDREALKQARDDDRMLRIGGSIGDALATYLNAQNQMNVKAPGVQVQQGAGLGKVADLFARAPEVADDLKNRREDLIAEYRALAEENARNLQAKRVAAYEKQVENSIKKSNPQTKPTIGQQTLDREFAKDYNDWRTGGKADFEENKQIFEEAIGALESGNVSTGTLAGVGARTPGVRTETRELETRVRKALNSMLRATLGAQFTEKEGEKIFQQTFDPFASPDENVKNMRTELNKIQKRAQALEQQGQVFEEQGTLKGFQASQPRSLSQRDQQALDWANSNPDDPRAAAIKQRLGM